MDIAVLPLLLLAAQNRALQEPKPIPSDPIVEDSRTLIKRARDLSKQGSTALPQLADLLGDANAPVRIEAVRAIADIGTVRSLDPLVRAAGDADPEVQIRAADGLVNFYLPGYLKTGFSSKLKRIGTSIQGKFTDTNDQIIPPYVNPRADVITALAKQVSGNSASEVKNNAARALGILRGRAALPELTAALRNKQDSGLIYESLVAIRKIGDPDAAPKLAFLVRDLDDRVAIAAIETTGVLLNRGAADDLRRLLDRDRSTKVKRAALDSLAMMADESNRATFERFFNDKDDGLRGAAAEGIGKLGKPADIPALEKAFADERKMNARLSQAYALVLLGKRDLAEFSPLRYLVNGLNSKLYKGIAQPLLIVLARNPEVLKTLNASFNQWNKEERIGLAGVLADSGDTTSATLLEGMTKDPDPEAAQEAMRAFRSLKARLR